MNQDKDYRKPVACRSFKNRHKTYFFDVYENRSGEYYLKLTQSIKDIKSSQENPNFFRQSIHLYKDSFENFRDCFNELVVIMNEHNESISNE
ncbi:MAG: PUR family DNA/RNA-binding protein [Flavobacteriaceae bacterium]|jgi:hypothetical protein|nr:PUR family DNA/RNA-binding protein [Flavobacteriaceae bacterium]